MHEIIKTVDEFSIIKLYANALYTDNGAPYYGDIYTNKDDLLKEHSGAKIMEGFGVVDNNTESLADDSKDWYDTIEDTFDYLKSIQ